MTTSREKFEAAAMKQNYALTFSQGTLEDLQETSRAWNIWKEARESMRDEAVDKCSVSSSYRAIEQITKAIKEIEL